MLFAVGVFIGCVAGLVAALALDVSMRLVFARQAVPVIVALLALVVASVALVESTRSHGHSAAAATITETTTVPASDTPSTAAPATDDTSANGDTRVPNVLRLPEASALSILIKAGFQTNVDTISLSNVPAGYVMSQSPLPDSTAAPGTTVNLQVSGRA